LRFPATRYGVMVSIVSRMSFSSRLSRVQPFLAFCSKQTKETIETITPYRVAGNRKISIVSPEFRGEISST
jgi:hypothetical protein